MWRAVARMDPARGLGFQISDVWKQADLDMVELSAAVGEIDLFYLDESGF